jgi:Tfp pilus assembly protein PilV
MTSSAEAIRPRHGGRSARRRARASGEAGFSLVEALAAVVLTALLMSIILPAFGTIATRWMTGQRTVEDADLWERAMVRLAADVGRAAALKVPTERDLVAFWRGDERQILFAAPVAGGGENAFEIVAYSIEPDDAGQSLVRRAGPYTAAGLDTPVRDLSNPIALASGPYRFRFDHVATDGRKATDWIRQKALPRRVELSVAADGARGVPAAPIALSIPATVKDPAAAAPAAAPVPPGGKPGAGTGGSSGSGGTPRG